MYQSFKKLTKAIVLTLILPSCIEDTSKLATCQLHADCESGVCIEGTCSRITDSEGEQYGEETSGNQMPNQNNQTTTAGETSQAGNEVESSCLNECTELVDCALDECWMALDSRQLFFDSCMTECENAPAISSVYASYETCEDKLEFAFNTIENFLTLCENLVVAGAEAGTTAGTDIVVEAGNTAGAEAGYSAGAEAGYYAGAEAGYSAGAAAGYSAGAEAGYSAGAEAGAEAGNESTDRVGPGDTNPVTCSGTYCPSARMSALSLPQTPDEATAAGCRLASVKNGTAFGGLFALAGDIDTNSFVQPDEDGNIQLILLNQLENWPINTTGNEAGALTSNFYNGVQEGENDFSIDPDSMTDGDAILYFENTRINDGLYTTPPSDFIIDYPCSDLSLQLRLVQTEISGFVSVDTLGFNMTEGVIGGYLTRDGLIDILEEITFACSADNAPEICDTIGSILTGDPESDLQTFQLILGGFDSAIASDGSVSACAGDSPDCNAFSV